MGRPGRGWKINNAGGSGNPLGIEIGPNHSARLGSGGRGMMAHAELATLSRRACRHSAARVLVYEDHGLHREQEHRE